MRYWLKPNKEFDLYTGCRRTGVVKTFFQMPLNEWICPDRFSGIASQSGGMSGLGDAYDDAVARGEQVFGYYYENGERKPMYYVDPSNPRVQEQLATPRAQELIRKTAAVRTYQQANISQLTSTQQAMVRDLMDRGVYRTVQEALDHVRQQLGLPPVDYSDAAIQRFFQQVESEQRGVTASNTLAWFTIGGAALLFGGALIYYLVR